MNIRPPTPKPLPPSYDIHLCTPLNRVHNDLRPLLRLPLQLPNSEASSRYGLLSCPGGPLLLVNVAPGRQDGYHVRNKPKHARPVTNLRDALHRLHMRSVAQRNNSITKLSAGITAECTKTSQTCLLGSRAGIRQPTLFEACIPRLSQQEPSTAGNKKRLLLARRFRVLRFRASDNLGWHACT